MVALERQWRNYDRQERGLETEEVEQMMNDVEEAEEAWAPILRWVFAGDAMMEEEEF